MPNENAILAIPQSLIEHKMKPGISSLPDNVMVKIMELLGVADLTSFSSTSKSIKRVLQLHAEQVISASLRQSLSNTELIKWLPFPKTPGDSRPSDQTILSASSRLPDQKPPKVELDIPDKATPPNQHLLYLQHAHRVCRVSDRVSFFSNWLHRVERHDSNGNHTCATEYRNNRICNETFRVVLFLAQNEVYNIHRYLRHCTVEERIAARCDLQVFDEAELPLPDNWWIRDRILAKHERKIKEIEAETSHGKEHSEKYLDYMVTTSMDESFQHRRMWLAKYLTKEANVTPARKIEEFEKQSKTFWYTKGIVTGLVFTQIAPLSWWHDSMVMGTWQPRDRDIRGFEYMWNVSMSCYQKAVKIVETLAIKD